MTGTTIEICDLCVSFLGRPALKNVNLKVPANSITVLIGPSGSGKTTLLRAINRLNECFEGCVTTGAVWFSTGTERHNVYASDCELASLRRRAAMCFQNPNPLPGSIASNFSVPLSCVLGFSASEIDTRMKMMLREVDLFDEVADRLKAGALNLSGGQQQRLCLARALALEPLCLLLDEPTASLDFRSSAKIEELMLRLKPQYTIVAVSHSLSQARRLADQIVVFCDGAIVQVLDRSQFAEADSFYAQVEALF